MNSDGCLIQNHGYWVESVFIIQNSAFFSHQVCYQLLAVAVEHIDDGNLDHGVRTRLLAHGSASHVHEHLTGERRVIDAHVELEELVLCNT